MITSQIRSDKLAGLIMSLKKEENNFSSFEIINEIKDLNNNRICEYTTDATPTSKTTNVITDITM